MKKQITCVLLICILFLTMAGCATVNAVQRPHTIEAVMEPKLELAQDNIDSLPQIPVTESSVIIPSSPAETMETLPISLQTPFPTTEVNQMLSKEQAQNIALDHLDLTAEQVTRMRAEYEIDDGVPQFDVAFRQGKWEFEFEIHAESGKILSYEKDHD